MLVAVTFVLILGLYLVRYVCLWLLDLFNVFNWFDYFAGYLLHEFELECRWKHFV